MSSPLPCPLCCSSCFALLVFVWTYHFLFLSLLSLFSSLLYHVVLSPFFPWSSCRIDHGYSAIVFNLSCSCCGCRRISRAFHVLYRSFFLSFSLVRLFHPFLLLTVWHPRLASISWAIAPSSGPLCTLFHSRNGHRNSWDEIDDYDVETTPNDQRLLVEPSINPILLFL